MKPFTLFPLEIRRSPEGDKYVVSNQPFASSPRSLNGTGYGTLNGKNLNEKAARSNWNSIRLPSLIDADACVETKSNSYDIRERKPKLCTKENHNILHLNNHFAG